MDRQTKLEGHSERNRTLIETFREKGVSLNEVRSIEVHFWAWGQPNAVRLAHALYKKGFTVLVLSPAHHDSADPPMWNVEAGSGTTISKAVSSEFTEMLTDLAAEFEADYDGWGTSV